MTSISGFKTIGCTVLVRRGRIKGGALGLEGVVIFETCLCVRNCSCVLMVSGALGTNSTSPVGDKCGDAPEGSDLQDAMVEGLAGKISCSLSTVDAADEVSARRWRPRLLRPGEALGTGSALAGGERLGDRL